LNLHGTLNLGSTCSWLDPSAFAAGQTEGHHHWSAWKPAFFWWLRLLLAGLCLPIQQEVERQASLAEGSCLQWARRV